MNSTQRTRPKQRAAKDPTEVLRALVGLLARQAAREALAVGYRDEAAITADGPHPDPDPSEPSQ
jgi:hypothetical protein